MQPAQPFYGETTLPTLVAGPDLRALQKGVSAVDLSVCFPVSCSMRDGALFSGGRDHSAAERVIQRIK